MNYKALHNFGNFSEFSASVLDLTNEVLQQYAVGDIVECSYLDIEDATPFYRIEKIAFAEYQKPLLAKDVKITRYPSMKAQHLLTGKSLELVEFCHGSQSTFMGSKKTTVPTSTLVVYNSSSHKYCKFEQKIKRLNRYETVTALNEVLATKQAIANARKEKERRETQASQAEINKLLEQINSF